jgi:hypothetical protein
MGEERRVSARDRSGGGLTTELSSRQKTCAAGLDEMA